VTNNTYVKPGQV